MEKYVFKRGIYISEFLICFENDLCLKFYVSEKLLGITAHTNKKPSFLVTETTLK